MADHYKVLGISRSATKAEIKDAFRRLAVQFHPDKHSHSAKSVRDDATRRFKQVSQAYEVLSDDRRRADYNLRSSSSFYHNRTAGNNYHRDGGGYGDSSYRYGNRNGYGWSYYREGGGGGGGGLASKFEDAIRYMSTRAFLLHIVFAGVLVGGMLVIETSREALWKAQNSGKSFEEAMESIEKAKSNGKRVEESFDEGMDSIEKTNANGKRVQKSFGEAIEKAEANRKRVQ